MTVSKKTSAAPYLPTGQQLRSSPSAIININDAACTYIGVTSSLRYSISISRNLTNDLVEPEHSVRELLVLFFGASFRIIWIWMVFVKKLHNVKAATIDIKMNIALFKIRCDRFPHFHFRVHFFDSAPSGISYAFAMDSRGNKKKIKVAFFTVNFNHQAADFLPILYDAVGFTAVNGLLNRIPRNDLPFFLEVVIPKTEFFHRTIIKGFLIIQNELFPYHCIQAEAAAQ